MVSYLTNLIGRSKRHEYQCRSVRPVGGRDGRVVGNRTRIRLPARRFRDINVVLVARRMAVLQDLGAALRRGYGIDYRAVGVDLSDPGMLTPIAEATDDIDVGLLVSNAGEALPGRVPGLRPAGAARDPPAQHRSAPGPEPPLRSTNGAAWARRHRARVRAGGDTWRAVPGAYRGDQGLCGDLAPACTASWPSGGCA